MRVHFLFFFIFFVFASQAHAAVNDTLVSSNCDVLGLQPEVCGAIQKAVKEGDITEAEERQLLIDLLTQGDIKQMHAQVRDWNGNIKTGDTAPAGGDSPETVKCGFDKDNADCIRNAWVRTFTAMPSFIESGIFFISGNGSANAGYYYELPVPPRQSEGSTLKICRSDDERLSDEDNWNDYDDCRTEFHLEEDLSTLKIKMNSRVIFYGNISEMPWSIIAPWNITPSESNKFSSELTVHSRVRINHYDWVYEGEGSCCEKNEERECTDWNDVYKCIKDEGRTEYKEVSTVIQDALGTEFALYHPPIETHQITFSNWDTNPQGLVQTDAREYEIQMEKGVLGKIGSEYNLSLSHFPYNVLTLVRLPGEGFYSHDIYVTSGGNSTVEFWTPGYNKDSCYFSYLNPFGRVVEECNTFIKASTKLGISTEKKMYDVNETVEVEIDFESDDGDESAEITVIYGGKTAKRTTSPSGRASASFDAEFGGKTITAYFTGDSERSPAEAEGTSVYATDKGIEDYFALAVMGFTVYGMVYFYRKYAEVMAG